MKKDKINAMFHLPIEVHRALKREAADRGMSMSAIIEEAFAMPQPARSALVAEADERGVPVYVVIEEALQNRPRLFKR